MHSTKVTLDTRMRAFYGSTTRVRARTRLVDIHHSYYACTTDIMHNTYAYYELLSIILGICILLEYYILCIATTVCIICIVHACRSPGRYGTRVCTAAV